MGQIPSKSGAAVPAGSISAADAAAIKAAWAGVKGREEEIGVAFFTKLFAAHPEHQKAFGRVKDVAASDLASSKALAVHSTTFVKGLGTLVEQLDDPAAADEMLYKIGSRHTPYGLTASQLQEAADILVGVLADKGLGGAGPAIKAGLGVAIPIIAAYT